MTKPPQIRWSANDVNTVVKTNPELSESGQVNYDLHKYSLINLA
jgi:hypothetical protein